MEATGAAGIEPAEERDAWLQRLFRAATVGGPTFALPNVLWYFGAISAAAGAIAIIDRIPESHRDLWEFLASLGFLAGFAVAGWFLARKVGRLPGGLGAAAAAAMVPAAGYGFTQLVHAYPRQSGFNPFVSFDGAIFGIALATAVAAVLAHLLTHVAFNLALAVAALLFAAQLLASSWHPGLDGRATTGLVTGSLLVAVAFLLDSVRRREAAFWPYAGGLGAITAALAVYAVPPSQHLGVWIPLLIVGTLLLLAFPSVGRRTWAVVGAADLLIAFAVAQVSADGRGGRALAVGATVASAALLLDAAGRRREAFWLYVGGLMALAEGLTYLTVRSPHSGPWVAMLVIGAALLAMFVRSGRKTFVVFGTAAIAGAYATSQLVSADGRAGRALVVATVVVVIGLVADASRQRLTGFWLQVGGLTGVASALVYLAVRSPHSEPWIPMLVIGAALLAMFVRFGRKTYAVFGAVGVAGAYTTSELVRGDGGAGRALIVATVVVLIGLFADTQRQWLTGFWLQVGGLTGVASALVLLAALSPDPEARGWIPMLTVGAILLLGSPLLQRRTWVVFGAAGLAAAFGHYLVGQNSWFRYGLLAIALVAFAAGIVIDRNRREASL